MKMNAMSRRLARPADSTPEWFAPTSSTSLGAESLKGNRHAAPAGLRRNGTFTRADRDPPGHQDARLNGKGQRELEGEEQLTTGRQLFARRCREKRQTLTQRHLRVREFERPVAAGDGRAGRWMPEG